VLTMTAPDRLTGIFPRYLMGSNYRSHSTS
jgi:hypothetical protein